MTSVLARSTPCRRRVAPGDSTHETTQLGPLYNTDNELIQDFPQTSAAINELIGKLYLCQIQYDLN